MLLEQYKNNDNNLTLNLPNDVRDIEWDIILVDAPAGYGKDVPCRMKSIYEAYNMSNNRNGVDILVHDAERKIETMYSDYFYKDYDLLTVIDDGKHGVLKHFKTKVENG